MRHLVYQISFDIWICSRCGKKLTKEEISGECRHDYTKGTN